VEREGEGREEETGKLMEGNGSGEKGERVGKDEGEGGKGLSPRFEILYRIKIYLHYILFRQVSPHLLH